MILPIGQLMMAEAAGPKRMGRVMSVVAVPAMLAPILGPTIGGLILDNASWRWIFYVNVPIGIIAVIAAMRILPKVERQPTEALDYKGLALMATGLPLITYGLAEVGTTGSFTAPKVLVPLIAGLALVAAFAVYALHVKRPLLNLRLYARPTFSSASIAMFCIGAALFGGMILLPLYWQTIRHEDVVITGLLTAPQGLGAALVMPLAGKLTDRFGGGPLALFGVVLTTLATIPFALIGAHTSIVVLCVAMLFRGIGIGFAFMPAMTAAFASLRAPRAVGRDAAAQRAPARRRLDRHRRPGRGPAARTRRRPHAVGGRVGLRHGVLVGRRADRAGDRPVHRPHPGRARRQARSGRSGRDARRGAGGGAGGMSPSAAKTAPDTTTRDAAQELGRAFKGCVGALRRLRGRENRAHGELSDAQYGLLFSLVDHEALPTSELALLADLSPATATGMLDGLADRRPRLDGCAPSATAGWS